jgi:hypothetical protein
MDGTRTVVGDVACARGGEDAAAEAERFPQIVDCGPLFGGERGGGLHHGGDCDEGDGRVGAEEVGRGCDSHTGLRSAVPFRATEVKRTLGR